MKSHIVAGRLSFLPLLALTACGGTATTATS